MNEEQDFSFASNSITTSKYTLWNFVPLFLFASFQCVAGIVVGSGVVILSHLVCACVAGVVWF